MQRVLFRRLASTLFLLSTAAELEDRGHEISRLREAAAKSADRAEEAEKRARGFEQKAVAAERREAAAREEVEAAERTAAQTSEAATAARQREDEARAQAAEAKSRAARSHQLAEEAQEEILRVRLRPLVGMGREYPDPSSRLPRRSKCSWRQSARNRARHCKSWMR